MSANNKPINAWLPSLAESVPFCPCPPEVSEHIPDTDKAETDGDIPFCELCELQQTDSDAVADKCQCPIKEALFDALDSLDYIECHTSDEIHLIHAANMIVKAMSIIDSTYFEKRGYFPFQSHPVNGCNQPLNLE